MLSYDFEESVGYWVCGTGRVFERALAEELAPLGITVRQCQVLFWLSLAGNQSPSELADRLGVEMPTLQGVLDRMERDRWIVRDVCPGDRRRKLVRPTARAGAIWRKLTACARRVRARAVRGIPPAKLRALKNTLTALQQNLGGAAPMGGRAR